MQSLYSMMLALAFFPFFLELPQEPQVFGMSSAAYAAQQYQDHSNSLREGRQLDAPSNTPQNSLYRVAYALSNTSTVYNSSESQGMMSMNSSVVVAPSPIPSSNGLTLKEFPVPLGSRPHDVAPFTSSDGGSGIVWYTAQATGELGKLDTSTGRTHHIPLGQGSAPHGVIVGPDGAPWVTDGGLNAIVRVDPTTDDVKIFPLPVGMGYANLNTATFDKNGALWFTGQSGIYGRLNTSTGHMEIFNAPKGPGPYGIDATPNGTVYFASLAGSYIARIDPNTGESTVIEPPTTDQGARRVWSDSQGHIWVSEWNAGKLGMYNPENGMWREWRLPGNNPMPYAVYVDKKDMVWLSDFGANAMVRFDPSKETFEVFKIPSQGANVRQILGDNGDDDDGGGSGVVWGAESGTDKLLSIQTKSLS
jgi:virginiamycin B lyase